MAETLITVNGNKIDSREIDRQIKLIFMQDSVVRLCVSAEVRYARSVRMMASSLAVVSGMGIDDVEDVRMAAEEGFVYSCATRPAACDMTFALGDGSVSIDFSLGDAHNEQSRSRAGSRG